MATSALFGREGNRSYDLEADLEAPADFASGFITVTSIDRSRLPLDQANAESS